MAEFFPILLSTEVPVLEHPDSLNGLRAMYESNTIIGAICFIHNNKVLAKALESTTKLEEHFLKLGKDSSTDFTCSTIPWSAVEKRLTLGVDCKQNTDVRTFFICGTHTFLVKSKFTFGYQVVQPNNYHTIQSTVSMALYVMNGPVRKNSIGTFYPTHQYKYRFYKLEPYHLHYIPENTGYIIVTQKKTLLSIHITEMKPENSSQYNNSVTTPSTIQRTIQEATVATEATTTEATTTEEEAMTAESATTEEKVMIQIYRQPIIISGAQIVTKPEYTEPPIPKNFKKSEGEEEPLDLSCKIFMNWETSFNLQEKDVMGELMELIM